MGGLDDVLAHEATAWFSLTGNSFGIDRLKKCANAVEFLASVH